MKVDNPEMFFRLRAFRREFTANEQYSFLEVYVHTQGDFRAISLELSRPVHEIIAFYYQVRKRWPLDDMLGKRATARFDEKRLRRLVAEEVRRRKAFGLQQELLQHTGSRPKRPANPRDVTPAYPTRGFIHTAR